MDLPPAVEVVEQVPAAEDQRSYTREDGTLVIDFLAEPPCGEGGEREIVVCAPGEVVQRYDPPEPPPQEEGFKPEVQLGENAKAGLSAKPGRYGAVQAMVDLTITF
jgi:hypothetical protein